MIKINGLLVVMDKQVKVTRVKAMMDFHLGTSTNTCLNRNPG